MRARRAEAAERFVAMTLPTDAEEVWRYSRIGQLDLDVFAPVPAASGGDAAPAATAGSDGEGRRGRAALIVVRNGRVAHVEVEPSLAAKGLVIADAVGLDADEAAGLLERVTPTAADAFWELNSAFMCGAALVVVPPGMVVETPVEIVQIIDGAGVAVFPRTVVVAGEDSEVTVIEHLRSADITALVDPVVTIDVGPAARVGYVNVQELGPRVWQIGYQASRVDRDATLRSSAVALGGSYARVRTDSRIDGKGGTTYLNAVYLADGERMHDFRTLQDHVGPSSTSDLLFKGAVKDHGRSVYSGLIRVGKQAAGTNAFQTNRNLVLSEGAGAESVPNLEIETNDVKCSHASAVGPIDEDQRYYLESRGVPPQVAERLIVMGFLGEVLDRLPLPSLAGGLRDRIAQSLAAKSPALGAAE